MWRASGRRTSVRRRIATAHGSMSENWGEEGSKRQVACTFAPRPVSCAMRPDAHREHEEAERRSKIEPVNDVEGPKTAESTGIPDEADVCRT